MEESPDHAARRIAVEWAGFSRNVRPDFLMVQSHLRPSRKWKGQLKYTQNLNHWDICFVYDLRLERVPPKIKPWWAEMKFVSIYEISKLNVGRGHKDILEEAKIGRR